MPTIAPASARIFLADDQPDILEALRFLLKGEGYVVDTVMKMRPGPTNPTRFESKTAAVPRLARTPGVLFAASDVAQIAYCHQKRREVFGLGNFLPSGWAFVFQRAGTQTSNYWSSAA